MRQYNNSVVLKFDTKATGNAGSGKPITVRESDGTGDGKGDLAALFDELSNPIENPTHTDSDGNYTFVIADGVYDIVIDEYLGDEFKTIIPNEEIIEFKSDIASIFSLTASQDQSVFELDPSFGENPLIVDLHINGRHQDQIGSGGNSPSFSVSGSTLTISTPLNAGDKLTGTVSPEAKSQVFIPNKAEDLVKTFDNIIDAVNSDEIVLGMTLNINNDKNKTGLDIWDVVESSTVTANNTFNIYTSNTNPMLSIKLRNSDDYVFNKSYDKVEYFGHRGCLKAAPQSTMAAFTQSVAAGVDGLEFDIQTDSEGQVWVFHDPNLSPDTQLTGAISDSTTAYIETAVRQEANGTRLDGIGIMKLEEVLTYASSLKLKIAPEMKFTGWTDANVDALIQILDDYGYNNDKCFLSAVNVDLLERARVTSKTVKVVYGLNIDFDSAKPDIDRVIALGNGGISWDYQLLLSDDRFIDYSFENGLDVIAFVVDDNDAVKQLLERGVNKIINDQYAGGLLSGKPNNNSLGLSLGRKWEDSKLYILNPTGPVTATVDVTGEVLTCYAPVGESSKASNFVNVMPGEVVTMSVMARLTSGTLAGIGIDYPVAGLLQTVTPITSYEWQWYECSFIVPLTAFEDTNCVLQCGVFGYMDGTAEFMLPRVAKGNVARGAAQTLAMGQLYFDSVDNTPKVNVGFCNHGVYSLSYDSVAKELSIEVDKLQRDDPEGAIDTTGNPRLPTRPLFFGNVVYDNGGAGLSVQFSGYTYNTGVLKARFYNSTGTLVDIIPLLASGNIYFNFKAEVS